MLEWLCFVKLIKADEYFVETLNFNSCRYENNTELLYVDVIYSVFGHTFLKCRC